MKDLQPLFPELHLTRPIIIAGPCSIESEEQTLSTAKELAKNGIKIFRGGIWKPRTSPGGFEGIREIGLPWLKKVKEETGLLISTEVANKTHVELALDAGVDMVWIGARTSANPFAMQEIADALKDSGKDLPVLVKNPVNPDLDLWIGALKRIYNAGLRRLGAIHRGFSTYGKHLYRNLPHWHIPIELQRRYPNLPLFCDPSHISGKRELIASVSQQALDMNFDGLIIESHCNPDAAWSDKNQQVSPDVLNVIINNLVVRDETSSTESLQSLRQQIDRINDELLELLAKRMRVTCEIGLYKKEHKMPVIQQNRYNDLMERLVKNGEELGMSAEFIRNILVAIHEESVRQQLEIVNGNNGKI
ncbi:MAG: bifunctional 3-deoxy-7-phosphoheptulonate synthase/chorismate mutase type II [Muribaculaceae bacterium]|nr:bifunctional 3-deoxy-7-phosphoheptulonate synthase/chorismate mutase type II [Muribaculaceae bacterium]